MRIKVEFDTRGVTRWLDDVQKRQIPFASALALTRLAEAAKAEMPQTLERILEAPKPFTTKSGVFVQRATKTSLASVVGFKDRQAAYLAPLLDGGRRKLKPAEQRFMGRPFVPGPGVRLDRYGNVPKALLVRILKAVQAKAPLSDGRVVFMLPSGVFARRRQSQRIEPLLFFADTQPTYKKMIDLAEIVGDVVQRRGQQEFSRALSQALRSAR